MDLLVKYLCPQYIPAANSTWVMSGRWRLREDHLPTSSIFTLTITSVNSNTKKCKSSLPSHSVIDTSSTTARTVFYTDEHLIRASSPGSWRNAGFSLKTLLLRPECHETAACLLPLTRTQRSPRLWWLEKNRQSPAEALRPGRVEN